MSDAPPSAHRHSVLLIEDHDDLRDAFVALSYALDLKPIAVSNGRRALELLREGLRPCLILLDLAMPDMDGLAFRREQMKDPALADLPVAVVSGAGVTVEAQARTLGLT